MFDLKLYSSNVIEIELASCVGYIGYISANIITKKRRGKRNEKEKEEKRARERERERERGRKMRKGKEKENGEREREEKWGRGNTAYGR